MRYLIYAITLFTLFISLASPASATLTIEKFTANGESGEVSVQSGEQIKFEWEISGGRDPGKMELEISPGIEIDYSAQGSLDHTPTQTTVYTLKVTDNSGKPVFKEQSVTVTVQACNADAAFTASPNSGDKPLTVNFNTSSTTGTLLFDYGDNTTGTETVHTYTAAETYTIRLTATVSSDCKDIKEQTITVTPPTCNADATFTASPNSGEPPLTVNFDVSSTTGTLFFDYGDNSMGTDTTHTYTGAGTYTVRLITDVSSDCMDTEEQTITVTCNADATFTADPTNGNPPLTVNFDVSSTTGTLLFDYGDGSPAGTDTTHIYSDPGEYTVHLTATVSPECTDTNKQIVTVTDPPSDCTAAPELIPYTPDPADSFTPTLEWKLVSGAGNYRIEIDNQENFAEPVIAAESAGTTSFTPPSDLLYGDIYWRVSSDLDYSCFSSYDHFVIRICGDADNDGKLDLGDAVLILNAVSDNAVPDDCIDGLEDAILILQVLAGF
ncbi:PKD domain-containing protein [Desulfococcaceae bacterium HSG8]|nr:PKD domain-containing protein [Desulfococcaceae bacterium HSG8]